MSVSIVTYNVLNPKLCTAEWFPECHPQALLESHRWTLVSQKITEWMSHKCIICLQEVSREWSDRLMKLFDPSYGCIVADYGTPRQDYMGVLVAWPHDLYLVLDCNTSRLVELPSSQKLLSDLCMAKMALTTPLSSDTMFGRWYNILCYYFRRCILNRWTKSVTTQGKTKTWFASPFSPSQPSSQDMAFSSFHRLIWIKFCRRSENGEIGRSLCEQERLASPIEGQTIHCSTQFCVTNYHMPCRYKDDEFMNLHTRMLVDATKWLSASCPFLMVGDFNAHPKTVAFQTMSNLLPQFLCSARDFTCWTSTPANGPFKEQLDYIWYSPGQWLLVRSHTPSCDIVGPLPTLSEPSDHLPVYNTFWCMK